MKYRFLIVIIFFILTFSYGLYNYLSSRCAGTAKVYKLELKGRVVSMYIKKATHFKLFNGNDTIEPYGSYSEELLSNLEVNDSLFKPPYNDSCFIYKQSGTIIKIIYGYCDCPEEERNKIKKETDESRTNK